MVYVVVVDGVARDKVWDIGEQGGCMSARMSAKATGGEAWIVNAYQAVRLPT